MARAGWKALDQLKEARTDRHVEVMAEFGRRWNSDTNVNALILESRYTPEGLAKLVRTARGPKSCNPLRARRCRRAEIELIILLRIPDFFEDLAFMAKFASLGDEALAAFKGMVLDEWLVWEKAVATLQELGDEFTYTQFAALREQMDSVPDV